MARRELHVEISLTEVPHYRLLVDFLRAVEALADERVDVELQELVEEIRSDLEGLAHW